MSRPNTASMWTEPGTRLLLATILVVLATLAAAPADAADVEVPGGTFTDDDGNVHEGYIEAIATAGITRGCNPPSNYYYCPHDVVTRGQMAAFLVRALGLSGPAPDAFSDDAESVFHADINALAAAGITRGCDPPDNTSFCPQAPVSRGQMAAFLTRAFGFQGGGGSDHFGDDETSIFEADIDRLATAGVTKGCDPPTNSRFCPDDPVRRDQMATFLGRSLGLDPDIPPPPGDRLVISSDTLIENEQLVLRSGDSIEFRNGASLMIGNGASVDWQGTPTDTWSNDGLTQNLRRDVRVFGHGDIMFMKGSRRSTIRYVEVDLQPLEEVHHYPLHWHHVGNGARGTLVEGVVVKNSTNRAFVPHSSHGITFRDTIAKNIAGQAYWWNPPPGNDDRSRINNSNDITYDHALADGVTNSPTVDTRRLAAFSLGAGVGNSVTDSVARNIHPDKDRNCSGFGWPEINISQPTVWAFENNKTFESDCHGIFVWQNDNVAHVIDGFQSTEGIEHGAYNNLFEYRNVDVPYVLAHAVGWSVHDSVIGEVHIGRHQQPGTIRFVDVTVDTVVIDNARNGGTEPGDYVFSGSSITCEDFDWRSWVTGTAVTIDDVSCQPPSNT